MPGIVSAFSFGDSQGQAQKAVELVLGALFRDGIGQKKEEIRCFMDGQVAIAIQHGPIDCFGYIEEGNLGLCWYGNPVLDGRPFDETGFRNNPLRSFDEMADFAAKLTGHFQLIFFDTRDRRFGVVTDQVSVLPFYETTHNEMVVVTPEVLSLRALGKMGWKPQFRKTALYEIISACHLLGNSTYWEGVTRVDPGMVLSWDRSGQKQTAYHYQFPFKESLQKSDEQWKQYLFENIQKDVDEMPNGKYGLALSGGYDSRGLLGVLLQKQIPFEVISYSFGDEFDQDADLEVARYFAKKAGVACSAYVGKPKETDTLIADIKDIMLTTGGENETAITYYAFLGKGFFKWFGERNDIFLRGDEIWGWGDYVVSRNMAFWRAAMISLHHIPILTSMMKKDAYEEGVRWHDTWRDSAYEKFKKHTNNPKVYHNFKDFLCWWVRAPRVIQNMGYYPRCFLSHQAPFIYGNSLMVTAGLPVRLRTNKRIFRRTMEDNYPSLFLDAAIPTKKRPRQSAGEIALGQPRFEAFLRDLIIDNPPEIFNELFHKKNVEELLHSAVQQRASVATEKQRYNFWRKIYDKARKNQWLMAHTMAMLEKAGKATFYIAPDIMLFRLVTLALALREYEAVDAPAS